MTSFEDLDLSVDGGILVGTFRTKDAAWRGGHRVVAWFLKSSSSVPRSAVLLADVARAELVVVSHNGQWVAIATGMDLNSGNGGLIHLCRLQQISVSCYSLDEHRGNVTNLLFGFDDKTLISTSWDDTARLWDLEAPDPGRSSIVLRGHSNWVTTSAIDPTGQWLATGGADQAVIPWNLKAPDVAATGQTFGGTEGAVSKVFFSDSGSRLFAGSSDGALHYWDLKRALPSADPTVLTVQLGNRDLGTGMTFTRDMRWAFTYEGEDGQNLVLRRVSSDGRADNPITIPFALDALPLDARFSDDNRWLVLSPRSTNKTKLYDLSNNDPLNHERDLAGIGPVIRNTPAFSPDSKWLITFDKVSKQAKAWDLRTPIPTEHELAAGDISLDELSFSPDGRWFLYQKDGTLGAVDLRSERLQGRILAQDLAKANSHAWFPPGGNRIAYVSTRASIVILDPEGKYGSTDSHYMGGNVNVTLNSDSSRLLTVSDPAVEGIATQPCCDVDYLRFQLLGQFSKPHRLLSVLEHAFNGAPNLRLVGLGLL